MKNLGLFDKIIFFLNTILATLLLLSYILPFLPPKTFSFLSVISLAVPVLIAVNVIFLIYWLLKFKKQVILSLLVLAIGFKYISSLYQFSSEKDVHTDNELSILSYNVRLFNRYQWIDEKGVGYKQMILVKKSKPDVFCVQEYYNHKDVDFDFYPHKYVQFSGKRSKTGQAIFSKYPIINKGSIGFPNTDNNAIYADILKGNDTVRIYNVHLESLRINPDVDSLAGQDSEKLIARMGKTFEMQQSQAELLINHKKTCGFKKVICGDFNNSPYSYVYKSIKGDMMDTFKEGGSGFGKTFNFNLFPMRIDFILADESLGVNAFKNYEEKYSDHFPIYARLEL